MSGQHFIHFKKRVNFHAFNYNFEHCSYWNECKSVQLESIFKTFSFVLKVINKSLTLTENMNKIKEQSCIQLMHNFNVMYSNSILQKW
jgi:hypothetical protein